MTARSPLLLVPVLLALVGGCVESDNFYIIKMQVPASGCVISAANDPTSMGEGMLDISLGIGYEGYPLVINNLASSTGKDGQPERNTLHLKGFKIRVDLGDIPSGGIDPKLLDYFDAKSNNAITPGGGLLAAPVTLIKDELAKALQPIIPDTLKPEVQVGIRAQATLGGSTMESSEFMYPITLCKKCLVDLRATCPAVDDKTALANVCAAPQDAPVTCCSTSIGFTCLGK